MKNSIVFFLFILLFIRVSSQNKLVFNQVLIVNAQSTVPANKVWKICGILPTAGLSSNPSGVNYAINFNGNIRYIGQSAIAFVNSSGGVSHASSQSVNIQNFWIPSGFSIGPSLNVSEISIIEFNIVP